MKTFIKLVCIYFIIFSIFSIGLITFAIYWPSNSPSGETKWWVVMQYFNNILVNTWSMSDWTVKKTQKIINQMCGNWQVLQWFNPSGIIICVNN